MKMLSIALVAVGLSNNMRNVITGIFLLLILCVSANRGIIGNIRKEKLMQNWLIESTSC